MASKSATKDWRSSWNARMQTQSHMTSPRTDQVYYYGNDIASIYSNFLISQLAIFDDAIKFLSFLPSSSRLTHLALPFEHYWVCIFHQLDAIFIHTIPNKIDPFFIQAWKE